MTRRSHQLAELSAQIQEVERQLASHRTAAPTYDADEPERTRWAEKGEELRAELHALKRRHCDLLYGGIE